MKRKVAVITGTRAEYGLLFRTLTRIQKSDVLELKLFVTGMHLSPEFGNTYRQIEEDGFRIDKKIDMLVSNHSPEAISKSMGLCVLGFAQAYAETEPDIIVVLGDRYEILSAVCAAIPFNIPIAHISGGEDTEGAIDNQIRHAITKIAHIHFPGADIYAENIKKSGEDEWRIFNVGDPGLENIKYTRIISRESLFKSLDIDKNKKTFLVTLHPVTLNSAIQEEQDCRIFFDVLKKYKEYNIVITYPNSDGNGQIIMDEINRMKELSNVRVFKSLGSSNYINLLRECDLVLGNSSSGLVEAPYFRKPAIDYGDRQKGRLRADNVIHVNTDGNELNNAIQRVFFDEGFTKLMKNAKSLYKEGETSAEIVKILETIPLDQKLLRKRFSFGGI